MEHVRQSGAEARAGSKVRDARNRKFILHDEDEHDPQMETPRWSVATT